MRDVSRVTNFQSRPTEEAEHAHADSDIDTSHKATSCLTSHSIDHVPSEQSANRYHDEIPQPDEISTSQAEGGRQTSSSETQRSLLELCSIEARSSPTSGFIARTLVSCFSFS